MNKFFFTIFLSLFLINISDSKEITYGEAAFSIIQYSNLFNEDISKNERKTLDEIKQIGKKMENSISEYFDREGLNDPTANFDWE